MPSYDKKLYKIILALIQSDDNDTSILLTKEDVTILMKYIREIGKAALSYIKLKTAIDDFFEKSMKGKCDDKDI